MKRLLCIIMCLLYVLILSSCGAPQKDEDFQYTELEDGTLAITKYIGKASSIVVPEKLDGKKVTRIGSSCFSLDRVVTDIVIPESITSIGGFAFGSAQKLNTVTVKAPSIKIDDNAFSGASIKELKIESEDVHIGASAFTLCSKLKEVNLTNKKTIKIDASGFASSDITNLVLSADDIVLADDAFVNCGDLKKAEIKCINVSVGEDAFMLCSDIETFTIDSRDEKTPIEKVSIGNKCFSSSGLVTFKVSGGSVILGDEVFNNNQKLKEVIIPHGTILGEDIFNMCWGKPEPQIVYVD